MNVQTYHYTDSAENHEVRHPALLVKKRLIGYTGKSLLTQPMYRRRQFWRPTLNMTVTLMFDSPWWRKAHRLSLLNQVKLVSAHEVLSYTRPPAH